MASAKITDLPIATSVNAGDKFEIVQGGLNKQADSSLIPTLVGAVEHWRGSWAGTTTLPVDADNVGSSANGDIASGDTFVFTNQLAFGGSVFPAKSIAVALQATPTTLAHWSILAAQT